MVYSSSIEITKAHQEAKEREEMGQENSKEKAKTEKSEKLKKQEKKAKVNMKKEDEKAKEKARQTMRTARTVITLKLQSGSIPIRVVKKGEERFIKHMQ